MSLPDKIVFETNQGSCISYQVEGDRILVKVQGGLRQECMVEMAELFNQTSGQAIFEFDFSECTYIDSMGLGQLIMFKNRMFDPQHQVRITHASKMVREIFAITQFDRLFEINS